MSDIAMPRVSAVLSSGLAIFLIIQIAGVFRGGVAIAGAVWLLLLLVWQQGRTWRVAPDWPALGLIVLLLAGVGLAGVGMSAMPEPGIEKVFHSGLRIGLVLAVPALFCLRWSVLSVSRFLSHRLVVTAFLAAMLGVVGLHLIHPYLPADWRDAAPLAKFNRGIAHTSVFIWALAASCAVQGRRHCAATLIVCCALLAALSKSSTAALAMLAGAGCFLLASRWPAQSVRGIATVFTIGLVAFPLILLLPENVLIGAGLPNSFDHRIAIWQTVSRHILEAPLLGWGPRADTVLGWTTGDPSSPYFGMRFSHAHNAMLQVWASGGIIALAALFGMALLLLFRTRTLPSSLAPYAVAAWASAVIVASVGFDFWTDALLATFAMTGFLFRNLATEKG